MEIRLFAFALSCALFLAGSGCGPTAKVASRATAKKVAPKLAEFAVEYAATELLHQQKDRLAQQPPPRQPILVVPAPGSRPYWNEADQRWYQANNVGGHFCWYPDGRAAGFSAYHRPSGQTHFFDPAGQRVR